jgi:hypothetical protein
LKDVDPGAARGAGQARSGGTLKRAGLVLAAAAAALPVGLVITFVLSPLWSGIERVFEVESMGHSGPATWCYLVVYAATTLALAASLLALRGR